MFALTRILVAKFWKQKSLPVIIEWENSSWHIMIMSKITAIINYRKGDMKSIENFRQIWDGFFT